MKKNIDVLLGLQWGDEGKGKIVDVLAPKYDIIARFQGGPNAGHSLEFNNIKHVLHTIPSGVFHKDKINIIGNGVVIDPIIIKKEIISTEQKGGLELKNNLFFSNRANLIIPTHKLLDAVYEDSKSDKKIGSTLKGIGPAYTDKAARIILKIGDIFADDFKNKYFKLKQHHEKILAGYNYNEKLDQNIEIEWFEAIEYLKQFTFIDSEIFVNQSIDENKVILAEGAQGSLLDIDFGTYPYVTSSNTISAGVCTGLGIAPQKIGNVYGITKAYCTRVGNGPFPTEQDNELGLAMQTIGKEYGSTTGRARRCGWLDLVALKYAIMLNGTTKLIITKADVLSNFDTIKIAVAYKLKNKIVQDIPYNMNDIIEPIYEELPGWKKDISQCTKEHELPIELINYIKYIKIKTGVKVKYLSVGPDRNQTIKIKNI